MLECPFEIINCSWPSSYEEGISEPAWDAVLMPILPELRCEIIHNEVCWCFNWSSFFSRCELTPYPVESGQMRGFQLVFRIKVKSTGTLIIWDDNGSVIRRNQQIIHNCKHSYELVRSEFTARAGDHLEIAQSHLGGEWKWYANLSPEYVNHSDSLKPVTLLLPYLSQIQERLSDPGGPALKLFTHGKTPLRSVAAVYSMVLNGYVPSSIYLFGEHQWSSYARYLFSSLLPFAHIVATEELITYIASLDVPRLVAWAQQYWWVMKTCISIFYPPHKFCLIDDDVFILKPTGDALQAFQTYDLVHAPDNDTGKEYIATWGGSLPLRTATFSAGLYWMRNTFDLRWLAARTTKVDPGTVNNVLWEQGFIATIFAQKNTYTLPSQRYFFPFFDGLPGGGLGYDYASNPCDFTSIHFGGLGKKPSDGIALYLLLQLLGAR